MQKSDQVYVGIDIGTTTTRAVIGVTNSENGQPTIIGVGERPTKGMRKGTVIGVNEVAQTVADAVEEAERIAGQHIDSAAVSINGPHIIGIDSKGVIAISNTSNEITLDDLERVEEAATVIQLPPNREILQVFARSYSLDGQQNIKEPLGMNGVRLEVQAHIVTAASPAVKSVERVLETVAIQPTHILLAGLAAAESVLEGKNRESGAVVIDIGAATTNVIVFEEDDVQHVAVIPIGSDNITNDLAIGLRTEIDIAEQVKRQHASALKRPKSKKEISFEVDGKEHSFKQHLVDSIVAARLEELFELVDSELKKIDRSGKLPGGALLVGGGSQLPDIEQSAKSKLALPARVAQPSSFGEIVESAKNPSFATATGLMLLDMRLGGSQNNKNAGGIGGAFKLGDGANNFAKSLKRFFDRFRTN